MTADIVRYEGTGEARAQAWASMPDDDRKRRAAGLRVSEIVALEWADVDLEGEQLTVQPPTFAQCSNKHE